MDDTPNQVNHIFRERLLSNSDLVATDQETRAWFGEIGLPANSTINAPSGRILVADPGYLCDCNFYSNEDCLSARFIKANAVVLMDFGGDVGGSVIRCSKDAYKILLTYERLDEEGRPVFAGDSGALPQDILVAEQSPGIDSGGLAFVDYSRDLRNALGRNLKSLRDDMRLIMKVTPGTYWIGYEQWDVDPAKPYPAWYRNIVIMRV